MSIADRTCRTCGKVLENEVLLPIFDTSKFELEIMAILEEFQTWNLNISQNDGLPQQICLGCYDSFCQIHNFRIMCVEAQMNFGEMCTGLDIIVLKNGIADDDYDFPENIDYEQSVIVQEHYKFPGDESKPSVDCIDEEPTKNNSQQEDTIKQYQCEYCMDIVSFNDPEQLNEHYNKLHVSSLPYPCPKCDKCFDTRGKRNSHSRVHYRILIDCEKCGKKIRGGQKMLDQHIENVHVFKERECPTCGKKFESISLKRFNYHLNWHDETKLFRCKYCSKKFLQATHLKVHERNHTGEVPFKCEQCDMGFKNPNILKNHIRRHGAKEIPCPECPKKFHHAHALKIHMSIHDPNRTLPYCEVCDIKYVSLINLRLHNYKKHNGPATTAILNILEKRKQKPVMIKPFKCSDCPQAFVLHTQLVKHLKMHQEDRPYTCKICPKAFKRMSHLTIHMNSLHLNKKPFKCLECGWAFPQRNNLNEHIAAKHGGSKDFKCNLCPKEFATIKSLKTHMVAHSDKKPYVCTVCNRNFKYLFVLKSHMNGHLKKNEADIEGGDITDIVVKEDFEDD